MAITAFFLLVAMPILVILGMPIAFALGVTALATLLMLGNMPLNIIPQKIFAGIDSFPILAIPFFILAGSIMTIGGINKKILSISNAIVGWVDGSLAIVTVAASMVFAAISGSAVATVAAIGGITIPAMQKEGYGSSFAAAVAASGAVCGPIIPPSIPLIVYGAALGMSINDLFIGSLVPGLMIGTGLGIAAYVISRKRRFPKHERMSLSASLQAIREGLWALLMPVIILGGIFFGIYTPTEASVIAVAYGIFVGLFIYKEITWKKLWDVVVEAAISSAVIMMILAASKITSILVVANHLSEAVTNSILAITGSRFGVLLLVNVFLLIVGCLMEANAAVVILTPILVPLVAKVGMGPLEFGVIMVFNLCLGLLTPPVGATLLLGNDIARANMGQTTKETVPFFAVGLVVLAVITAFPQIITFLPHYLK
ncbi:TRAP transporter large permease [Gelria sp. Kuro-4]|uniref:TRAP transporter large permease n=1 Tax=Gelria sp. Kuro-4 TaxID=2796927 RepID=UPI001BEE0636|nr:TRAP transporter large permease subunit [Gelria sp. Kuro-4]BCV23517.1 hypothetical protein kuro4_02900 [Gelria sp. Kuro-4]